jgi:hypothetical protein
MRHTCITCIAKSKTVSKEKIKSHNQIKMCMCRDMMDMVRWILGPEWALDIAICIMNVVMIVRCTLGPEWVLVITIWFVVTPFCRSSLSTLTLLWTWLSFLFLFFSWTFMCPTLFFFFSLGSSCVHIFFYSHVSFVILTWREREREREINT